MCLGEHIHRIHSSELPLPCPVNCHAFHLVRFLSLSLLALSFAFVCVKLSSHCSRLPIICLLAASWFVVCAALSQASLGLTPDECHLVSFHFRSSCQVLVSASHWRRCACRPLHSRHLVFVNTPSKHCQCHWRYAKLRTFSAMLTTPW